ncbi:MAG: hypothetical protein ACLR5Q_03290 [Coprococcus sp.]
MSFTVCDAGCDGFHDAGYDLCAGTPCIRCCKRINEVLDTEPAIEDGAGKAKAGMTGEVEFRHVSFKYRMQRRMLEDGPFTAHEGTVAFIGSRLW